MAAAAAVRTCPSSARISSRRPLATSVCMFSSRLRSRCDSAELILPSERVSDVCVVYVVLDRLRNTSCE